MKFRKIAVILGLCTSFLLQGGYVKAEMITKDMLDRGAKTAYILYDNTNGLPTSEANTIAQTKDGFIWIGSYSGLICYDGNNFYRFDASTGIASVVCLFVDSKDRLWIGTNDSGLALYDKGKFTFFDKNEGLMSSSVRSIAEDENHDIVVATTQGLAYVDENNTLHQIEDPQINNEYIKQIRSDSEGRLYGITVKGRIFSVEDKKVTTYNTDLKSVNCICPDPKNPGYIYVGTGADHMLYGDITSGMKNPEKYNIGELSAINDIHVEDRRIWVCTDNGIGWMDDNHVFRAMKNIPLNNAIDYMMEDREGNRWFVSSRQGVMKVVNDPFTDIFKLAGLSPHVVNSTCKLDETLYIGTDTGLIALDKNFYPVENEVTRKLSGVRVRCVMKDRQNNLWISTYNGEMGLICYTNGGIFREYNSDNGLLSNWVRATTELKDGSIAVAVSGGVNLIRGGQIEGKYDGSDGVNNTEILSICEGPNGELYLGSDGDGIYVVESGKIRQIGAADGLPSEVILRMRYDEKRDVFWIITSSSLAVMKEGKIEKIKEFPYSNNFDLVYDNRDNIWVISSNGLYAVNGDDLLANGSLEYQHYDSMSGLPHVGTANSWSELTDEGTLFMAGTTGVSAVNINSIQDDASDVSLAVPYIEVDDEKVYLDNNYVEIPKSCQRLVIHAFAPTYSLKNPKITYKLEGFDDTEIVTTKRELTPITYTNLAGRFYRFTMNVVNPVTSEIEGTYTIGIEKQRRWYEEVWFWIVLAAVLIVIMLIVVRMISSRRIARAERKTKETQMFIDQTISAFAKLIDAKDKYTQGHSRRVAAYTEKLAIHLGFSPEEVRKYKNIALLHDIGKVAIPDNILNKPKGLTDEEYEIMKSHAARGQDILEEIKMDPDLALGAGFHHERFDGRGYPLGLHGDEIPDVAQLIAIADTFDAMYSTRPYRKQLPLSVVLDELESIAGTQLNEEYVRSFLELARAGEIVNLEEAKRREEAEPEQPPEDKTDNSDET